MNRKQTILALFLSGMLLFATNAKAEQVTVKAGTQISAVLNQTLSSKNVREGETVFLTLANPVTINKQVALPAGSTINAQVVFADDADYFGQSGELTLRLFSVVAPDGTLVPITATQSVVGKKKIGLSVALGVFICPLFWLMHGGEAVMNAGSTIFASVAANTDIEI